ncbi:hypothetical protein CHA01nite_35710 [Chryseobacterium hagamense]|uniref:YhcG N-terminal domain-containing protein n=1 Tax=Chryseobacterium hagamense TaxID=395935 RepID=A0A511YRL4_9FLAO|nr:DUF1016 N-terminal domain-containing protein [Chryseobacterium hagamense]GEN77831.1 hypothetical protein CHA01nite_35710 [Chryseobacterium hagamense]
MMPAGLTNEPLLKNISALLENARNKAVVAVNQTIVLTYFEIGRMMVEDEQHGESRAEYGKEQLKFLSKNLTKKFGKGFSETNLKQMRQFFLSYSICQTVSDESESLDTIQQSPLINFNLSWSHYLKLMRIKDPNERSFYEIESYKNNWSVRELQKGLFFVRIRAKLLSNIPYRRITNRFLRVNTLRYCQVNKILLTF